MPNPKTAEHQDQFETPNAQKEVIVHKADLPLFCPNEKSALWCSHPRVFLPIEDAKDGISICPYCSTKYQLEN
ncbi:MAG TPA: zinc-finger domain-containing protein [Chromatiales bacterium]|nr:zinc-finger domain-containing protein [Thiotrichales bacterium]HIP67714.1 zinc-finger domain-containing protein [Chromatiales bacterium]